ncbi:MAG TPA: Hsp20/alpha crystallin family protein [Dehalococcoidia bacterium]|nr:Hsp20/alpha crystallin family protein [Dehalococcoidia bacterium]
MANLVRWDPWQELATLRQQMDRLFEDGFGRLMPRGFDESFGIAMDVVETPDRYTVKAAVPGVKPEDVDISVEDGVLTIKGEHREEHRDEKENYLRRELRYGAFERSLRLPPSVDADRAEAHFANGMLTLSLPKRAEAQPKKIRVSAQGSTPAIEGEARQS